MTSQSAERIGGWLLAPLLAAALLAPYFRRSQRVKRTFVNP